jgi:hypothetical protein
MRSVLRIALWVCLALVGLAAFIYASDDVCARLRGRPVEHIRIGRYYAVTNRWEEREYSVGSPTIETCVDALLPHFGHVPCWYLKRHTIQEVDP